MFASDAVRLKPLMTLATTTWCTVYIVLRIAVRCVHTQIHYCKPTHYYYHTTYLFSCSIQDKT